MRTTQALSTLVFIFCAIGIGSVAAVAQTSNQSVYTDSLQNGWQNWSWAAVNLSNTSPVHSGKVSIAVTAGPWEALYVAGATIETSQYVSLNFWINGGAAGGQKLQVQATVDNDAQGAVELPTLPANTWTLVSLSLKQRGVTSAGTMDGFWIQDRSGNTSPTFYIDDVTLIGSSQPAPPEVIAVDASAGSHPISPLIYGVAWSSQALLTDLNVPSNRMGGNNMTRYNWLQNAVNLDSDWYFESMSEGAATSGAFADSFVGSTRAGGAASMITVPMAGWIARLGPNRSSLDSYSVAKYGKQTSEDPYWLDAGNGMALSSALPLKNNPADADMPSTPDLQAEWVKHLVSKWGTATDGGVKYYLMDNEPSIWFATHRDIHPVGATMDEVVGDIEAYAGQVKAVDPTALVVGPEEYGWSGYFYSGYDQQWGAAHGWSNLPDQTKHNGADYVPYLLQQLSNYQAKTGQRLLDVFSLHFYPQSGEFSDDDSASMKLMRNRSTRQLWDPNYVSESWINSTVELIPRMKTWVQTYYPGTKIGITEYNWGDEGSINGATTQADILGIFGREGLDLANRWATPAPLSPVYNSIKMYRNYDGQDSCFGDTSVSDTAPAPDNISSFAALRASDGALTIMVINKMLSGATSTTVKVAGFSAEAIGQAYQLTSANVIKQLANVPVTNNQIKVTLPPESITLFVLPHAK